MFDLQGVAHQIYEYTAGATGNVFVLTLPMIALLTIVSGLVGRVAILLEDLCHRDRS